MKLINRVLAIETSCDDTSVAIVANKNYVESLVSANQDLAHAPYGGVVPEIASRNHTLNILPLVEQAFLKANKNWTEIDAVAVTNRPGLVGSLIVGLLTAKTLAQVHNLPLIGVSHLEGHILAPFLKDDKYQPREDFNYPFIALAVSGGHTSLYLVEDLGKYKLLGSTLDDAAGEAFDKFAKMLGLGFPGGVKVDQISQGGNFKAFSFPRSMILEDGFEMSFSGLKSSAHRLLSSMSEEEMKFKQSDLCASFQEAIVDVLLSKLEKATQKFKIRNVVITGGVSANSRLRDRAEQWSADKNIVLQIPPLKYCTDNAAMIGLAGLWRLQRGESHDLSLAPSPAPWDGDFIP